MRERERKGFETYNRGHRQQSLEAVSAVITVLDRHIPENRIHPHPTETEQVVGQRHVVRQKRAHEPARTGIGGICPRGIDGDCGDDGSGQGVSMFEVTGVPMYVYIRGGGEREMSVCMGMSEND